MSKMDLKVFRGYSFDHFKFPKETVLLLKRTWILRRKQKLENAIVLRLAKNVCCTW